MIACPKIWQGTYLLGTAYWAHLVPSEPSRDRPFILALGAWSLESGR